LSTVIDYQEDLVDRLSKGEIVYDSERGVYIDVTTGVVIEEGVVSQGKEWREYSPEDRIHRSRVGPQITNKVHDGGLTSYIESRGRFGRKLSKLNQSTRKPRDYRARKEVEAKIIMNDAIAKLGLPEFVAETVGGLLKEASKMNLLRRNTLVPCVAAMIMEVCRIYGIPIEGRRLRETMRIDDKGIHSCLKKLSWAGIFNDIKKRMREKPNIDSRAILAPASYIPKIASSIGLSDEIILLSRRITEYMARHCPTTASGKNPEGTAAASIYLASILLESKKPQKSIADSLGISEVTIRNRYRDIIDNLDIVVYV